MAFFLVLRRVLGDAFFGFFLGVLIQVGLYAVAGGWSIIWQGRI
jgi:hypothetical protein